MGFFSVFQRKKKKEPEQRLTKEQMNEQRRQANRQTILASRTQKDPETDYLLVAALLASQNTNYNTPVPNDPPRDADDFTGGEGGTFSGAGASGSWDSSSDTSSSTPDTSFSYDSSSSCDTSSSDSGSYDSSSSSDSGGSCDSGGGGSFD